MIICASSSHRGKHILSISNFFLHDIHVQFIKKPADFECHDYNLDASLMKCHVNFEGQGSLIRLSAKPKCQGHRQYKDRHRSKESPATTFRGLFLWVLVNTGSLHLYPF